MEDQEGEGFVCLWRSDGDEDRELWYGPRPQYRKTLPYLLEEIDPTMIWNVQSTSDWATAYHKYIPEGVEFIRLPLDGPEYTVTTDKALAQLKQQCHRVVSRLLASPEDDQGSSSREVLYIHGFGDGKNDAGHIALICQYWLRQDPEFDPVRAQRDQAEFEVAERKEQRKVVNKMKEYIQGTQLWWKARKKRKKE